MEVQNDATRFVHLLDSIIQDDAFKFQKFAQEQISVHFVPPHHSTNYFCYVQLRQPDKYMIRVVIDDRDESVRAMVQKKRLTQFVFFGYNRDPVNVCSAAKVIEILHDNRHPVEWGGIETFAVSNIHKVIQSGSLLAARCDDDAIQ